MRLWGQTTIHSLNEQHPLDNGQVPLLAARCMSQLNVTVERSRWGFFCTTPSCRAVSPILCDCLGLDGTHINSSSPLGQQSRPDSGDIPISGRPLPGPGWIRTGLGWQLSTAVWAQSLPAVRVRGSHD